MANDGSVVIVIDGDDTKLKDKLDGLGKVATGALKGVGVAVGAATAAVGAAAVAIGGLAASAAQVGAQFEQTMANTSTMFGDVAVDTDGLNAKILALSSSTGVAANEIGNSLYNALSAGIPVTEDMGEAMGYMDSCTKLAKAGFTDVDTAVTATAKILNAYGMDVSEVGDVHKILMQTQNKGITTVDELGASLAQVTPTAAAMGVGFDQVGAALANMTAAGTPTAQATTQLNSLFAELGKSGTTAQKGLESALEGTQYAGKSFQDLMAQGVPLNEILDLMGGYADKSGKGMLDMFSSIEGGKAALAMSGENSAKFTENLAAMATESDVVGDAYAKVTDTFQAKTEQLKENVKNLGIAVYKDMQAPLKGAAETALGMVGQLADAFQSGGLAGAVGALGSVFAQLAAEVAGAAPQMLDAAVGLLQALITGLSNNLPALAQGATGIVTGLVSAVITLLPQLALLAVQLVAALVGGIGDALPTLIPAAVEAITMLVQGLVDNIPVLIDAALQLILGLADGLIAAIPVLLEAVPAIVTGLLNGLLESIPLIIRAGIDLLTALVTALPEIITTIVAVLPDIINSIITTLLDNIPVIVQAGIDLLVALIQALPQIITTVVAALPKIISSIVGAIIENIDQIILAGVQLFMAILQNLPTIIVEIAKAVPQIVNGIVDAFWEQFGTMKDIGGNLLKGIWQGIQDAGGWLFDQIADFFGGMVDKVKDVLGIHSPSKVFAQLGGFTVDGFVIGMENRKGKAVKTAQELSQAILQAAGDWVEEKKFYNQLSAKDETAFWEELIRIGGLGAAELAEVNRKLYTARAKTSKDAFTASKEWIEREKFYNRLSAQEEAEAWQRVAERKNLAANEQLEAEKKLYTARLALQKQEQETVGELLEEQEKAQAAYQKNLESRTEQLRSFSGLFDEVKTDSEVTGQALLSNLRGQVSTFKSWQADMEKLAARGVTGPLLEELQEMGPKAAQELHALTQLTDKQLEEYASLFAEQGKLAAEQAQKDIPPVTIPLLLGELDASGALSVLQGGAAGEAEKGLSDTKVLDSVEKTNGAVSTSNSLLSTLGAIATGIGEKLRETAVSGALRDRAGNDLLSQKFEGVTGRIAELRETVRSGMQTLAEGMKGSYTLLGRIFSEELRAAAARLSGDIQTAAGRIVAATERISINISNNYYTTTSVSSGGSSSSSSSSSKSSSSGKGLISSIGDFIGNIIKKFADGGFPTQGDLFIAGEAGPELVGTLGGHTAVANNSQIIGGIQAGVRTAMAGQIAVLQEQNQLLRDMRTVSPRLSGGMDAELSAVSRALREAVATEAGRVGAGMAERAEGRAAALPAVREVHTKERTVERVARLEGDGMTGELIRMLRLRMREEDSRVGGSLLAGG